MPSSLPPTPYTLFVTEERQIKEAEGRRNLIPALCTLIGSKVKHRTELQFSGSFSGGV
jgi:hypothetical protein